MCLNIDAILSLAKKHRLLCVAILLVTAVAMYYLESSDQYNHALIYAKQGYEDLGYSYSVGILLRLFQYCWSTVATIAFLALVPSRRSILSVIGQETLDIYLVHTFMIGGLFAIFRDWLNSLSVITVVAIFSVLVVISCAAVIVLHHSLLRLLRRIQRIQLH